ncbi:MAG: hypothetical protein JST75_22115 [Bacteroidetes bacterium]|nr:hypothetical protein [Bacteroidota bacterium]
MRQPADMLEICRIISEQLESLQVKDIRNIQTVIYHETKTTYINYEFYRLSDKLLITEVDYSLHPEQMTMANTLRTNKQGFFTTHFDKSKLDEWTAYQSTTTQFVDPYLAEASSLDYYFYSMDKVALGISTYSPLDEENINLFKRFRNVFELAYRRYADIEKSEANAREAVRRASLDRVRAEIASMRTTKDLEKITPLIWHELNILGITFNRCGVFIMDDRQQNIQGFLSTPDGKAIAAFHLPYANPGVLKQVLRHWEDKKIYVDHWIEKDFATLANTLFQQGSISSEQEYMLTIPHGGFHLHFLPFLQGMLYVGNTTLLDDSSLALVQSIADAFSTAYARYEDFNKLEAAKQQVEKTLADLKQAQTQLIQAEKMASLGELTAGIAHEIQNPLNFVNNFSEVSNELLDEMKSEISKGDKDEVIAIANDLQQNLEKILHHGKRADAIVKGMLQHSRVSGGQKEPTDINALADEYLRLAYHGLRAKDKEFNASIKTEFDSSIGKINIVPQDIGRMLLNIYSNAFYAVSKKKKEHPLQYAPAVSVNTKKIGDKIEIRIKDNGIGVPRKILDKIFQPFFTTKPTGQGTGLGLSLAYDIVKAHNGEINIKTNEGEGTEFIIGLTV